MSDQITPIVATNEGGSFELVPSGTHIARCYSMVHIGTVKEDYMGEQKQLNKVRLTWELPTETKVFDEKKGEQPFSISREFTLSMGESANLRKILEGWRGKGFTEEEAKRFDITKLLEKPCMVSVIHKVSKGGKQYAMLSSVSALPKGIEVPPQINKTFCFSWAAFDQDQFDKLPEFLRNKMIESVEYKKLSRPDEIEAHNDKGIDADDGLPF